MADLDRMEELARAATPGPWFNTSEDDRPTGSVATNPLTNDIVLTWADGTAKQDARYIAAFSPERVVPLLAVVRAAKRIDEALAPVSFERGQFADLRTALAALDALENGK